jgi:hypothetical protein
MTPANNPFRSPPPLPTEDVLRCMEHGQFLAELSRILLQAEEALASCGAVCLGGGACCKFDLAGHRLFVSTGELALLLGSSRAPLPPSGEGRCPHQVGPRCTARERRPLGCRTFFCRVRTPSVLADVYERHHGLIRSLHQTHCLPYAYAELTLSYMQFTGWP